MKNRAPTPNPLAPTRNSSKTGPKTPRLRKIILPIFIIASLASLIFVGLSFSLRESYRAAANAELSDIVGADLLRAYGYTNADFALPSAEKYSAAMLLAGAAVLIGSTLAFFVYFYFYELRNRRAIAQLITYVEKLNEHIYDLKIDANTEDELSLLSNELYKITVTLKTSAEYDRALRRNLETALADISHQLKTPLTSLQIALDNLSDPAMPPDLRADFLSASGRQVAAMSRLITTLLNLARFDNGTIRLVRRPQPIGEIIARVLESLEILADLKNVKLETHGDLDAIVNLDARWQAEALTNIVKNCIEYSPSGETVEISVATTALYTRLTIRDYGPGIAPRDLPHIFERFYQTSPASTPAAAKTPAPVAKAPDASPATNVGIGLAFAKTVIEADSGEVHVKSTPGSGTTFTVTYFAQSKTTRLP